MQVVHFMALVIRQLGRRKALVHRHLDGNRVSPPALPVLFGEPVAPVLDNSDGHTALFKRLPGDVVARSVLKRHLVPLKGVQVAIGLSRQLLLDLLTGLSRSSLHHLGSFYLRISSTLQTTYNP